MIFIIHEDTKVVEAFDYENNCKVPVDMKMSIQENMVTIASQNPDRFIGWCNNAYKDDIRISDISSLLTQKNICFSYAVNRSYNMHPAIGYIDQNIFINVPFDVSYPTWLMSSNIGVTSSDLINGYNKLSVLPLNFEQYLCSLAKLSMPNGTLCRSEPTLLQRRDNDFSFTQKRSIGELFKFVKYHYKATWYYLLLMNFVLHEKRYPFGSFLKHLFKKKLAYKKVNIDNNLKSIQENNNGDKILSYDVIIPTLNRKPYLLDVLKCLANQTILPNKVIIVEQQPDETKGSELDYLNEDWPFSIDHTCIHQLGACNARNIAINKVTAEWAFFADDDILFLNTLMERVARFISEHCPEAFTISCAEFPEKTRNMPVVQSGMFGAGCSFVTSKYLAQVEFKKEHEFGFGEDLDFGNQLRNLGVDILYVPGITMQHLKAQSGGFRYVHTFEWEHEKYQPKPSPTVMAYYLKHSTKEQLKGYRTTLFMKYYKSQPIKNPFKYVKIMRKKWKVSEYYAQKLMTGEF